MGAGYHGGFGATAGSESKYKESNVHELGWKIYVQRYQIKYRYAVVKVPKCTKYAKK